MQDKKLNYVLLSVPLEALEDAGIRPGSLLEITAEEKKVCIRAVEDLSDFVCDGDCENCPVNESSLKALQWNGWKWSFTAGVILHILMVMMS